MVPTAKEYLVDMKKLNLFLLDFPIFNSLEPQEIDLVK